MKETKRDAGYSWLILFVCFLNNFIVGCIFVVPAVFMIEWSQYYGADKTQITAIGSVFASLSYFTGIFIGPLAKEFGCRFVAYLGASILAIGYIISGFATSVWWLIFSSGVVLGIGEGLIFNPPIIMIQYYFDKKRPLAAGISLMGRSGGFAVAPIVSVLNEIYGWRGTLLLLAGFAMQMYILGSFYIMPNIAELRHANKRLDTNGTTCVQSVIYRFKNLWNLKVLKNIVFLQYLLSIFFGEIANDYIFRFTPLKAVENNGIDKIQASFLPLIAGLASTISRLIISFIANIPGMKRTLLIGVMLFLQGVFAVACCFAWNFNSLASFIAMYGVCYGAYTAVETTAMVDLFGIANLADCQSFRNLAVGVSFLLSMALAGMLIDVTGNYDLPNFLYGPLQMCSGVLMATVTLTQKFKRTESCMKIEVESIEKQEPSSNNESKQENI